jgi:hypothetical protein
MAMTFGTWNARNLHRTGALKTVARELGKYKSDLVGVQEILWRRESGSSVRDTFFCT